MVSFFHYVQAIERKKLDFHEFATSDRLVYPCKWHHHVEAWRSNPYNAQMLFIRYEDLLHHPVDQLQRFTEFINLPVPSERLQHVAEAAKFDHLRAKEIQLGHANPKWPSDKPFFRRGVDGSYRDEMPQNVLHAFLGEAAATLRQNNYALG